MEPLTQAVNVLQESLLFKQPLPEAKKAQALLTICSSFKQDNPYLGFVSESFDRKKGLQIISCEKLHTKVGAYNVLGLEAARLLKLFEDQEAQENILPEVEKRIKATCFAADCTQGECAHAAVALWRYQAAGGLLQNSQNLNKQLLKLQKQRGTFGCWKGYPFYYTLLALLELNNSLAETEIKAVSQSCFRRLKRMRGRNAPCLAPRRIILERALEKAAV